MASTKYQAARRDRVVSKLARLEENRRCIDCDNLGPQYVVCGFGVFACVTCSGAHREFGHRVKGISLCSFSEEEVNTLEAWGNKRFFQKYCAKLPRNFGKPTDRNPDRLREWIERVYIQKSFYKDDEHGSKRENVESEDFGQDSNLSDGIAVIPLSDIFGHNTPLLKLSPSPVGEMHENVDEKSVSQEAKIGIKVPVESEARCNEEIDAAKDLIADWDPFGVSQEEYSDNIEHGEEGDKESPNGAYQCRVEMVNVSDTAVPDQETSTSRHEEYWDPFETSNNDGDDDALSDYESKGNGLISKNVASIEKEYQEMLESLSGIEERENKGMPMPEKNLIDKNNGSSDVKVIPAKQIQREIPLEEFYPEFAEIRATGILPDGRPVPSLEYSRVQGMPDSINPSREQQKPMPVPWTTESKVITLESSLTYKPVLSSQHDMHSTPPYLPHVSVQESGTTNSNRPIARPTSSVMQVSSASRASDTLYGGEKAITGYNLNAPCAPQAKDTGNPFA